MPLMLTDKRVGSGSGSGSAPPTPVTLAGIIATRYIYTNVSIDDSKVSTPLVPVLHVCQCQLLCDDDDEGSCPA